MFQPHNRRVTFVLILAEAAACLGVHAAPHDGPDARDQLAGSEQLGAVRSQAGLLNRPIPPTPVHSNIRFDSWVPADTIQSVSRDTAS